MSFFINFQGTAVVEATMIAAATVEAAAAMIDTEYRTLLHVSSFAFSRNSNSKRTFNAKLWWMLLAITFISLSIGAP
jgi:hypothetical protein